MENLLVLTCDLLLSRTLFLILCRDLILIIDLYQPERLDPQFPIEDTVGAIADLIKEGKVRYLGLSEATSDQIRKALEIHPVSAVQIEYSLSSRVVELHMSLV